MPQEIPPGEKIYWLDKMRTEMAERNKSVGTEVDHLDLLEEGPKPRAPRPSRQELVRQADETLSEMERVEKRIEKKYGSALPLKTGSEESLDSDDPAPQPSISH